jgi:transposase-like protein
MGKQKRYSDQFKQSVLEEASKGDINVSDLLAKHNITKSTFYKWKNQPKTKPTKRSYKKRKTQLIELPIQEPDGVNLSEKDSVALFIGSKQNIQDIFYNLIGHRL